MRPDDCLVHKNSADNPSIFKSEGYRDLFAFHAYLLNTDREKIDEAIGKYQAIISLFNFYAELRKRAEEEYRITYCPSAISEKKEIPICLDSFYDALNDSKEAVEPPLTLIVEIADKNYETVRLIGENLNKLLRRERRMVSLDKAQQIDNQCIRWIARQPGYTAEQKAGPKQQIMAVIRQESFNTLENRVFKHFTELCVINAVSYIREYGKRFRNSRNLKLVRRLLNLCLLLQQLPEFEGIARIYSIPQPNYVLQNNPRYRTIWLLYQQLVSKQKIIESLWPNRHNIYREFVAYSFISILHQRRKKEGYATFSHYLWMKKYPDSSGRFFSSSDSTYTDFFKNNAGEVFSCSYCDTGEQMMFVTSNKTLMEKMVVCYLPEKETGIILPELTGRRYLIITEGPAEVMNKCDNTIIFDLSEMNDNHPHELFRIIKENI